MENIEKTKDYDKFKFLHGNRPLEKNHIKKLKASIVKNNYLSLHPIIVNTDYEIIDGQHRFQCAKELDIEIYYIRNEKVTEDHLIDCNVNQRTFEVKNYIDFFAVKEKNPDYVRLKQMLVSTKLFPKALLNLILGAVSSNLLDFLKTGKFKFPTHDQSSEILDFYQDFIVYVKDKRIKPLSMFTNHYFTRAIRWLYLTERFDKTIFFSKLDLRWYDLKPQYTSEKWYELLIQIYNFKNHNRLDSFNGIS